MTGRPRIAGFVAEGKTRYGLIREDGVVDLSSRNKWPTLREVIADGALKRLADSGAGLAADYAVSDITYAIPVPHPEKILCVGVNFPDRNEEYKDGSAAPKFPSLFPRFPGSFVGHGVPLTRPFASPQLDYEGEVVLVIGKEGRHIAEADALDHVAALTLCNEGTIRDWVRHAKFNVTQGKNFEGTGSIGPWLVPYEDESQLADIRLTSKVNGELRQDDRSSRMTFGFRFLISYISTFTRLIPGDIIVTGTPTGAGARFDPPKWLVPGDVVEVEADGIGILRNGVVDEVRP
ncbi:MAG TPA: fumarylacetoacetate hydrolase family protein [Rhizobiaceae bacterium]|nr:fumarylacetoacetate hydrolase family protein [Rhizobiaceae bacterium]